VGARVEGSRDGAAIGLQITSSVASDTGIQIFDQVFSDVATILTQFLLASSRATASSRDLMAFAQACGDGADPYDRA
jgi:hypothetical protein